MLCANQQMLAQAWPFLEERPPVLVDWLPWSHTFGGNHNFNLVLRNGGTLYIDGGKPVPGLVETTRAQPARDLADACTSTCRAASTCCCRSWRRDAELRRRLLPRARRSCSTPPRRCRRTCGTGSKRLARRRSAAATRDALGLGLDRDLAARDLGALPDRAPRRDRPAGRGLRAQARADRRQARGARARAERHARLLPARPT